MGYDFFAARREIEHDVQDLYAQVQLLANDLADDSAKKRASERHLRLFREQYTSYIQDQLRQFGELLTNRPLLAIGALPKGTAVLWFKMRLARPFLSKDDAPYHICDNPVRKEWVFRVPMMPATGWKGALRAAALRLLARDAKELGSLTFAQRRFRLTQLFGNEKGLEDASEEAYLDRIGGAEADQIYRELLAQRTETGFLAGRLRCYPTFFDKVAVEVINPHDRVTKAGKWPVYFESVDIDATGTFALLYVPLDLIGLPEHETYAEISDDLKVLGPTLQAMLTTYGFGAKTSSGFGVAADRLVEPGRLVLKVAGLPSEKPEKPQPAKPKRKKKKLRRYWRAENQLRDEFLTDGGDFVSEEQYRIYIESLGQEYTKSDRQLYDKARKWWEREGKQLAEKRAKEPEPEPEAEEAPWAERTFSSLGKMVEKMEYLAGELTSVSRAAGSRGEGQEENGGNP